MWTSRNNQWVGHTNRTDQSYRVAQPWAHGHFPGGIGASYVYRLGGGTRDRFRFGNFFFSLFPADYAYCSDWLWDSDDIVVYDDPDHPGPLSRLQLRDWGPTVTWSISDRNQGGDGR